MSMHANISWRCKEEEIRSSEKQGSGLSQMQRCCQSPVLRSYTLLHLQGGSLIPLSFAQSPSHWVAPNHSLTDSLSHSLTHSVPHSLTHSNPESFTHLERLTLPPHPSPHILTMQVVPQAATWHVLIGHPSLAPVGAEGRRPHQPVATAADVSNLLHDGLEAPLLELLARQSDNDSCLHVVLGGEVGLEDVRGGGGGEGGEECGGEKNGGGNEEGERFQ